MPTYVHCPQCRRAYDAAAGPCEACAPGPYHSASGPRVCAAPTPPESVDDRLELAMAEIRRLQAAIDAISVPPPPAVQAVVRFVPKRWASAIARVVGSVRRAWTYAIAAGQNS